MVNGSSGLSWLAPDPSDRVYEYGVDRGVLYPNDAPGVAWDGLTDVTEIYTGVELRPIYVDGVKRNMVRTSREFRARVVAFNAPVEFNPCVGMRQLVAGFWVSGQIRETFGMSYRTRVGDSGHYKLHLIYNATASMNASSHPTLAVDVQPNIREWMITAVPIQVSGHKPTPHYIFDTRKYGMGSLDQLERILYGRNWEEPRLPSIDEILTFVDILDGGDPFSTGKGVVSGGGAYSAGAPVIDGGLES
jgi:hypothetical protein